MAPMLAAVTHSPLTTSGLPGRRPGQPARFALRRPVAPAPAAEIQPAQTVLVADDEEAMRSVLSRLLTRAGIRVIEAEDGLSALAACRTRMPDLVLLDASMPGKDGFEVCREIKADPATALIPVVLVTGFDAVEDRIRGADVGADDFYHKPIEALELLARVRSALRMKKLTDGLEAAESVLFSMARIVEARDSDTEGHCSRLSVLAEKLAKRLGMSASDQSALRRAGILHDIGKVVVPDAVLLKRGPLTDAEWQIMREHAAAGERICAPLRTFADVLPIIRHHHERRDGSGYPDRLAGDAIPMGARVLQVVDVFDALTMPRPYKAAMTHEKALFTMEDEVRRGWWDPTVFGAFTTMIREGI